MSNPLWTGPSVDLQFANGTVKNVETRATTSMADFSYRNGTAVYERLCSPHDMTEQSHPSPSPMRAGGGGGGYPSPYFSDQSNISSGYFSNDSALHDTAILSIPNFMGLPSVTTHFATSFLRNATAAGKKNVIIDLSGNSGGAIISGINLFQVFFPGEPMYVGSRFRTHPAVDFIGRSISRLNASAQALASATDSNPFTYKIAVRPDQEGGFASWKELYGPHEILNTNSSSLHGVYNFTAVSSASDSYPVNGYGPAPLDPSEAMFAPEDITMVSHLSSFVSAS